MSKEADALMTTANIALKDIIQSATSVKEFMMTQLPDVLNQLLMWQLAHNIIWLIVNCIIIYSTYLMFINAGKHYKKSCDLETEMDSSNRGDEYNKLKSKKDQHETYTIIYVSCFTIGIIISAVSSIPGAINNLETVLKIWIAPKIFLIEYAAELVK